jgi:predicted ATP-grasp superfamily ATP-dependent carboligase
MASIVYIARDIERALGKEPKGDYYIITNTTPYALEMKKNYKDNIFLIENDEILDTYDLLTREDVGKIIDKLKSKILVFKNTLNIEDLCKEKGWELLNPSARFSDIAENKISQVSWLGELSSLLPPHSVDMVKNIKWNKKPFILQWSHGHTGDGTILIQNEKDLENIKNKFPHRDARVTDFIKGPVFTINIVVGKKEILYGNISYQITGISPFTENPFSTIGNDWSVPYTILSDIQLEEFQKIAENVANKMQKAEWLGLFGIDIIYDEERNTLHLLEINGRQPASTTFESELQLKTSRDDTRNITIFEAHLKALTNTLEKNHIIMINDGAQILQRLTKVNMKVNRNKLIEAGYKVIEYNNTKPNSDYLRIQSDKGIMETHNKFNTRGKAILESLI